MLTEAPTFYQEQVRLGTTLVGINEVGTIFAKPRQRRAIATYGLGECTAVVIQFTKINEPQVRGAVIAHYLPIVVSSFNVENGIRVGSQKVLELGVEAKALIVSPGTKDPFSPTRHSPAPSEDERVAILTRALKNIFGEQIPVSKVGYRPWRNRGWVRDLPEPRERGTVLVEYLNNGSKLTVDGLELRLPIA